jgi:hypothetical protein
VRWSPLLPEAAQAAAVAPETRDPELTRAVELRLPTRPRAPGVRPGQPAQPDYNRSWPDWPTLGDVAGALHDASGLELLVDSYVRSRVDPACVAGRQPVGKILETLSRELHYAWQKQGNLLLLRSRAHHWDRVLEVPERVLRPWRERALRPEARPLDATAELAAALNDRQTLGMSMHWGWYLPEPKLAPPLGAYGFHQQRRHLRFWAALGPVQREQALSGARTPTAGMNNAQRAAFVTALTDPDIEPWESGAGLVLSRRSPTPAALLAGGFRVNAVEWRYQRFFGRKPSGETTEINALHPASRPPVISNLPPGFEWSALGTADPVEKLTFAYHLGGESQPARTVELWSPR